MRGIGYVLEGATCSLLFGYILGAIRINRDGSFRLRRMALAIAIGTVWAYLLEVLISGGIPQ